MPNKTQKEKVCSQAALKHTSALRPGEKTYVLSKDFTTFRSPVPYLILWVEDQT